MYINYSIQINIIIVLWGLSTVCTKDFSTRNWSVRLLLFISQATEFKLRKILELKKAMHFSMGVPDTGPKFIIGGSNFISSYTFTNLFMDFIFNKIYM